MFSSFKGRQCEAGAREVYDMDFMSVFLPVLILGVVIVAVLVVVATVASAVSAAAVEDDEEDE